MGAEAKEILDRMADRDSRTPRATARKPLEFVVVRMDWDGVEKVLARTVTMGAAQAVRDYEAAQMVGQTCWRSIEIVYGSSSSHMFSLSLVNPSGGSR